VRVVHQRERLLLGAESRDDVAVLMADADQLDRDLTAKRLRLFGEVDGAHAALTDRVEDPVDPDARRNRGAAVAPGSRPRPRRSVGRGRAGSLGCGRLAHRRAHLAIETTRRVDVVRPVVHAG